MSPFCYLSYTLYVSLRICIDLLPILPHPFIYQSSSLLCSAPCSIRCPRHIILNLFQKFHRKNEGEKTLSYLNSSYINFYHHIHKYEYVSSKERINSSKSYRKFEYYMFHLLNIFIFQQNNIFPHKYIHSLYVHAVLHIQSHIHSHNNISLHTILFVTKLKTNKY